MAPKSKSLRPLGLPSKYEFVQIEGEGGFGKVVKCVNKETLQIVAIKMPTRWTRYNKNELPVLKMCHNLDKRNIVKYIDSFPTIFGKALVFEALDISLFEYMKQNKFKPLPLSDIRTIIQQMATAFDALKGIRVTHTDVKSDNIMIGNRYRQPLEAKLIDFGLAFPTSQAEKFRGRQIFQVMSPEVFLGRKFDEAIDMWALGCVMFEMVSGHIAFRGKCDYETMLCIVELLGKPADHILEKSNRATVYFTKTAGGVWRIKTPLEYYKQPCDRPRKSHKIQCLDELKTMRLEEDNETEAVEREQCIELLKAMMAFDADERITPQEVLKHPFITKVYPSVQTLSEDFQCEPPAAPLDDEDIQPGHCNPSPEILRSGANPVQPVTAETITLLEEQDSTVGEPTAAPLEDEASSDIQTDDCNPSPEILPSGVILVQPVTVETTTLLEDQESSVGEPTAAPLEDEASSDIQPDDCNSSPETPPSGVILIRPHSSAETATLLEDQEIPVSFQSGLNRTLESAVSNNNSNREISEDSTTCEDTRPKKKKNCFRRVVSWLSKTFCCCVSCVDED